MMESNGGCGMAPVRCVIMVATARQPARGPDLVFLLCRMVCGVATALRRRVPHGGGILGAVRSVSLVSLSARGYVLTATSWVREGC
jgi:hypothetical protein